ncbi:hypothetical protein OAK32_01600 [Mariniblastus sp.]|nr:hypothetical protein [Mariniblastus sp.]
MQTNKKNKSPMKTAELFKRGNAFVVTSMCILLICVLTWPLSVSKFRSLASVRVITNQSQDVKAGLEERVAVIIESETTDEQLAELLSKVARMERLRSTPFESKNFNLIRDRLKCALRENELGYDLELCIEGDGTADESEFVSLLAKRFSEKLQQTSTPKNESKAQLSTILSIRKKQDERIEMAHWLLAEAEKGIGIAKDELNSTQSGTGQLASSPEPSDKTAGTFQLASSRKKSSSISKTEEIIGEIDLASIKDLFNEMKQEADSEARLIQQLARESATKTSKTPMMVAEPTQGVTSPLNVAPTMKTFGLLGLVSLSLGLVVAVRMDPFAARGFENARSIAKRLEVPVIAQIRWQVRNLNSEEKLPSLPWANRISMMCGLALLGIGVVVAGFVLINPAVRTAFYEDPLVGCSMIVRIFVGF